jgi:hypothetical protein
LILTLLRSSFLSFLSALLECYMYVKGESVDVEKGKFEWLWVRDLEPHNTQYAIRNMLALTYVWRLLCSFSLARNVRTWVLVVTYRQGGRGTN